MKPGSAATLPGFALCGSRAGVSLCGRDATLTGSLSRARTRDHVVSGQRVTPGRRPSPATCPDKLGAGPSARGGSMIADLGEWLGLGPYCWEATPFFLASVTTCLGVIGAAFSERVHTQRWIRYRIELADDLPVSPGVHLTPVTDAIIGALRRHPDHAENQLTSGFRFWDRGLRRAYVWMDQEQPLCIQWLLTDADRPRLRT